MPIKIVLFWLNISYYSVTSFRILGTAYTRRPWKWGTDSLGFFLPRASERMGRFFTQLLFHNSVSFNALTQNHEDCRKLGYQAIILFHKSTTIFDGLHS